jgi:hypothetical protein
MQTAHCWVALGGDTGNTVPKFDVTPAEIAVLQLIHGSDAVFDIVPVGDINRSNRDERSRLQAFYGKPEGSREASAVDRLFPGIAARLPESFNEIELDESFFKATERATLKPAPIVEDVVDDPMPKTQPEPTPVKKLTVKEAKAAAKAARAEELKGEPQPDPELEDDGIDDMPDKGIFK